MLLADDAGMQKRTKIIAGAAAAVALAGGWTGAALAGGNDDDGHDQPITGEALSKASAVALGETGGGKVTGSEIHDEEGYYEVEVTKDGKSTDVHLDQNFKVLTSSSDKEGDRSDGGKG